MIPKILHLYWGRNLPLSYLRYLTVASWIRYNPDWKVIVGTPTKTTGISRHHDIKDDFYSGEDFFDRLEHLPNVEILEYEWGKDRAFIKTEVQRSDIYRWEVVSEHGGLWSDFDIIYFKPMMCTLESHNKALMIAYRGGGTIYLIHPIGFWGCVKGNGWIKDIGTRGLNTIKSNPSLMQGAGAGAIPKRLHYQFADYLPEHVVYPFAWNNLVPMLTLPNFNFQPDTIGIHWFGGSPQTMEMEKRISPNAEFNEHSAFDRILEEMTRYDEQEC
jgi:hypothetical protein